MCVAWWKKKNVLSLEESQRMCVSAFPLVKGWLQQLSHPHTEMVQPICSFISMTVANNRE